MLPVHARKLFVLPFVVFTLALVAMPAPAVARQPGATAEAEAPAGKAPKVPPLPEGSPAELMQFIDGLKQSNVRPKSRPEMMAYLKDVATVSVQAADKILAQVKPTEKLHEEAAKMKLESLMMLGRLGDEKAAADMAAYAGTLVNSASPELATEAKRLLLVSEAQQIFSSGKLDGSPALIKKTAEMLAADPDDAQTAGLAMQLASAFENLPGGEQFAATAYTAFGPIFAKSKNEQVRSMAESFAGTIRRLSLPGHPMEIKGTLLSGKPFDQASLAGKVVLVDF